MCMHVARMRKTANLYRILERKLLQTCPHGRPRRKLENNIKIDLEEIMNIRIGCNWLSSVELLESANILLAYGISVAHNALQIQKLPVVTWNSMQHNPS